MTNELLYFFNLVFYLGLVLVLYKLFGKNGLYVYSIFASLLSCVADARCTTVLGLPTYPGLIFYASVFLVTDILSEKYGKKSANKAVIYGLLSLVLWLFGTQSTLMFSPNERDVLGSKLNEVLGMTPRIFIASIVAYIFSQAFDVFMYHFIWSKTGNNKKMLWLRNNVSTFISNAIDTTIFTTLAFVGMYPVSVLFSILMTSYLFKSLMALLDTPFIYFARKIVPLNEQEKESESSNFVPSLEAAKAE